MSVHMRDDDEKDDENEESWYNSSVVMLKNLEVIMKRNKDLHQFHTLENIGLTVKTLRPGSGQVFSTDRAVVVLATSEKDAVTSLQTAQLKAGLQRPGAMYILMSDKNLTSTTKSDNCALEIGGRVRLYVLSIEGLAELNLEPAAAGVTRKVHFDVISRMETMTGQTQLKKAQLPRVKADDPTVIGFSPGTIVCTMLPKSWLHSLRVVVA